MRIFVLFIFTLFFDLLLVQEHVFTIMEWNCENLFDCRHDSLKNDYEWLPESEKQWKPWRYWHKLNTIGQTILACGEQQSITSHDMLNVWHLPDIVVLTEVENDSVLNDLTHRSLLRKARFEYILTDSPDERGIDVALLYSPFTFSLIESRSIRINPLKNMRPTRDILYAKGIMRGDDTLHVFALHAPSRAGGERRTRNHRKIILSTLLNVIDSVRQSSPNANIVIAGDFNDYSTSKNLRMLTENHFVEISRYASGCNGAYGTYKYKGEWGSLDHIFTTQRLAERLYECTVFDAQYLIETDETYGGVKPRRTYLGSFYRGGTSDHLPLVARFSY